MIKAKTVKILMLNTLLVFVFSSCASHGIRGQAPFVQINSLKLQDQTVNLDLGVRNVNSEPLFIEHIEFSISLDDTNLAIYKASSNANVSANGIENLRFELAASSEGVDLLSDLENGHRPNLEYSLQGIFMVGEKAELKVMSKGHIYPVPGRPGQFR